MGLDGDDVEELVSKTGDVGTAAASVWSTNKLLLAVLPPTLALLSVGLGVWQNTRSEANDNRLAREARAEEAAKEQAAIAREQEIRVAELVLPRYETLLTGVRSTMGALQRCSNDIDGWLDPDLGIGLGSIGTAAVATPDGGSGELLGDAAFLDSCLLIEDTLAPLVVSLDQALLVSEPDLEAASNELEDELVASARAARRVATASGGAEFIDRSAVDESGRNFDDYVTELRTTLEGADAAANDVVVAVRGLLLTGG